MAGLDDYGALLRSGQAAVPDYAADEARKQLLATQQGTLRLQMQEAQRQIDAEDAFETDFATVLANPTAEGYAHIIAKHPKFATQTKASWDVLDKKRQQSDLQSMGEIYAASANGKHDLAAALMQRRIDADKAAGQEIDPNDQAMLDALQSADPVEQKAAMGMIGATLAVLAPDRIEALSKLTDSKKRKTVVIDDILVDTDTGEAIAQSPYADITPGQDGAFFEQPRVGTIPVFGGNGEPPPRDPYYAPEAPQSGRPAAPDPAPAAPLPPLNLEAATSLGGQFGRVTSTTRSPAKNKAVGGVKNSWHLRGRAIDIARKPGVSHARVVDGYRRAGYQIIEQLDEGDHSHIALAGGLQTQGVKTVRSLQEARALPPGTQFRTPDGRLKVR